MSGEQLVELAPYLKLMVEKGASDLYFSPGAAVGIKIEGLMTHINRDQPLSPTALRDMAYHVMNERQRTEFERDLELDMAMGLEGLGRFRINVFWQRGHVSMVVRHLKSEVPQLESLGLPPVLAELIMEPRGLILVVGATGSGKSTTLASMIQHRNAQRTGHILTIEDPVEYIHKHQRSIVNQREVGVDTVSYGEALRRAMREAPDVIMIGEIRDQETMKHALTYAETGHLCISTLHSSNASKCLRRIVNFFPPESHPELLLDLSLHLKAIISQRLLIGKNGKRVPAVEVLLPSPFVRELIQKGEIDQISAALEKGGEKGMLTFEQSIIGLFNEGRIDEEEALKHADSRTNLAVKLRLRDGGATHFSSDLRIGDD
jgi:twitching motility protein PilU